MAKIRRMKIVATCMGIIVILLLLTTGCSGLKSKEGGAEPQAKPKDEGPSPLYYDFGDVLVPSEMKVNKKTSFVYQTAGFSSGVLVLSGRIESSSLFAFFETNMVKDNWRPVSSFKSPRTIMLFQKENRWCVISITDGDFKTHVEIWVAPTIGESVTGLLK